MTEIVELVEIAYYRYGRSYVDVVDSVEDGLAQLEAGEDHGSLSGVGVYVNGEPAFYWQAFKAPVPTAEQATVMRETYGRAMRRG